MHEQTHRHTMHTDVCAPPCTRRGQRTTWGTWFFSSTMWFPGDKLTPSNLIHTKDFWWIWKIHYEWHHGHADTGVQHITQDLVVKSMPANLLYLPVKHDVTMCTFHTWRRWWTSTAPLPHWPHFTFIVILECVHSTHDKNLLWIILNSPPCCSGNCLTCLLTWYLLVAARGHAERLTHQKVCVNNFCKACSWRDSTMSWWFNSNRLDLESPRWYSSRCVCEDISERFNWEGKMYSIYSMEEEVC